MDSLSSFIFCYNAVFTVVLFRCWPPKRYQRKVDDAISLAVDYGFNLSFQVNTNGVISFLVQVSQYTPDPFPLGDSRRLVAPFWADVDTRNGGQVFYRETTDSQLLKRATNDVTATFVDHRKFKATWLFVATWHEVAFYGAGNFSPKVRLNRTIIHRSNCTKNHCPVRKMIPGSKEKNSNIHSNANVCPSAWISKRSTTTSL